jgi:hypothetical protein
MIAQNLLGPSGGDYWNIEKIEKRDVGGREELAGGRPRGEQRAAQRHVLYRHISDCGRWGMPLHPVGEHWQEPHRQWEIFGGLPE